MKILIFSSIIVPFYLFDCNQTMKELKQDSMQSTGVFAYCVELIKHHYGAKNNNIHSAQMHSTQE